MTTATPDPEARLAAALLAALKDTGYLLTHEYADSGVIDVGDAMVRADPTLAADLALAAAIRATAADGKVDAPMYFTDATYHAIVYRIFRGTPPNEALREAAKEASE